LQQIRRPAAAIDTLQRQEVESATRAIGLAMCRTCVFMQLLADWPFDMVLSHNSYRMLNSSDGPLFDVAAARRIAILNADSVAGGISGMGGRKTRNITY
jgi:aryl-alcohol dehydrogenase-like predicted oxidoreductase